MKALLAILLLASVIGLIGVLVTMEHAPQKQLPLIHAKAPILARAHSTPCPVVYPPPPPRIHQV